MARLHNGQSFPSLHIPAVGGGQISLPDDLAGSYGVVLFCRGSWCPFCNAQLAAFAGASDRLTELGVEVVALSVDDEQTSAALADKHRLSVRLGHSADADKVAAVTGAYTNDDPRYLQSTGFVLGRDGVVLTAVYSSGAVGRLVAEDVVGFVADIQSRALIPALLHVQEDRFRHADQPTHDRSEHRARHPRGARRHRGHDRIPEVRRDAIDRSWRQLRTG